MNNFLLYLLKSTLILSVLYLVFSLLMRKENFFKINRMVLLLMVLSAALIPFLPSPQLIQPFRQATLEPIQTTVVTESIQLADPAIETVQPFYLSPENILIVVYLAGAFVSLLLLLYSIGSVLLLFRTARKTVQEGIRLMIVPNDISAFSFGRSILISQHDYELHSQTIITHELSHIRMGHFYDLVLMELAKIIFWFNPLVYRMVNDLKEIHEFQADDQTLTSGIDATKYQLLIIQKSVGHQRFALANSFNHCQIKNRITMMNKQKTSKAWSWKVATFFPLLALLLMAFGKEGENVPITVNAPPEIIQENQSTQPPTFKIEMRKDGNYIDNRLFTLEEIGKKAEVFHKSNENAVVSIKADKEVPMEKVTEIKEVLRKAKVLHVNLSPPPPLPQFSIEIRNDGNYIANKLCSLKDIGKKAELWQKSSPDEILILWLMGAPNSRLSEVEEVLRKAKVQHIDVRVVYLTEAIPLGIGQMDVPPKFPGGVMALRRWVAQNIKYPGNALENPSQGKVYVRFLINTEGMVKDPAIVKGIDPFLDKEALRVVSQLPKWEPGKKDGRAINVNFYMPITFGHQ